MEILRIDSDKKVDCTCKIIEINIDETVFTLTNSFGKMRIQSDNSIITIHPGCANTIEVD